MDRWACVDVSALPLQLLLRRHQGWKSLPTVVVSEDKPQGIVRWANAFARKQGALSGQNYALALSLVADLRAGVVSELDVTAACGEIKSSLWRFSPRVEEADEQGVFWLDATGLGRLYPKLTDWADEVRKCLTDVALQSHVVVGFSRFGTYAVARSTNKNRVFENEAEEREALHHVKLAHLDIEPNFRDELGKLGVHGVAELLDLPAAGLLSRFGKRAYRLHCMAAGDLCVPFEENAWVEELVARVHLDDAESDSTRLLFVIKRLLDSLVPKLVLRGEAIAALILTCSMDRAQGLLGPEEVRPTVPTLDVVLLLDLVRLRIETLSLDSGVVMVAVEARGVKVSAEQLRVFSEEPRRDLAAGGRALARLRAELGEDAVVCAVLSPGHLPEASFVWHPVEQVLSISSVPGTSMGHGVIRLPPSRHDTSVGASLERRPLIRRVFAQPPALHAQPRHVRDSGWLVRGALCGAVTHEAGPFLVSGGWWVREVQRDYRFVLTQRGDLLWIYHDRRRRRLCLHGEVQ